MPIVNARKTATTKKTAEIVKEKSVAKTASPAYGAVRMTHPQWVVFPVDGYTKRDVAAYYAAVVCGVR